MQLVGSCRLHLSDDPSAVVVVVVVVVDVELEIDVATFGDGGADCSDYCDGRVVNVFVPLVVGTAVAAV